MMSKMGKGLLITGGSGLLGSNLSRMATASFDVYATYNSHAARVPGCKMIRINIADKQAVSAMFADIRPTHVIHTVAQTDVDYCEQHPTEARAINVAGTENVALASRDVGAKLIHISTDSVFDGKRGMYTETDIPHPVNIYAATKVEAEKAAQVLLPDSVIVRTAFYGWNPVNVSRVSLAGWVVSELRHKKQLNMFTDAFFSPIETRNLSEALIEICRNDFNGIYHIAGSQRCSKYEFGMEIARVFALDSSLIHPSSIAEAGLKAPRPKDISLDITKASKALSTRLLSVREGLISFRDSEAILSEA